MKKLTQEQINWILEGHKHWLNKDCEGWETMMADFSSCDLRGAEQYKTKWHKVAEGDYPPCEKGNCTVNVLTHCGDIAYYNYDDECWIAEPSNAEIDPPVAWCEIPKFEE